MTPTPINQPNIFQKEEIGKVRTAQEDSHINDATPNGHLFVVCDGMGGHVGGAEASSTAVKSIFEFLKKETYNNLHDALNNALQFANTQILGKVSENSALKGMGTTACILLLQDDKAYIAHVGDSRIYLYLGKEKKLHRITKDHSFVQTLVDVGEISDEEAEKHPDKNRILKALGVKLELMPTICDKAILPKNGDIFLLCSDGLNGMLPDSKIETVLKSKATLQEKGDRLITLALEAGGHDNITLQLIEISGSPHKISDYKHCDFNPKTQGKPKSFGKKIKKRLKLWIALSIVVLLCMIGAGTTYYFIEKKSIEKNNKEWRDAEKECNKLQKEVQEKEEKYEIEQEKTKDYLNMVNNSKNKEETQKMYDDQKENEIKEKTELDNLKIKLNIAEQKKDSLKNINPIKSTSKIKIQNY